MKRGRSGRGGRRGEQAPAGPPPSAAARAALGPYARGRLTVHALGHSLALDVPGDVFSTQRIDEGTQLLLGHLPPGEPASLLDLGCGYGALGLPVAARFPRLRALLVDRDLLAVEAAAHNARALGLSGVEVRPSLGYRGLPPGAAPFDWLLCNVPARIGPEAIGAFLERGQALLAPGGELRVVVIRDLVPVVEAQAAQRALPVRRVVDGPRHTVFALPPGPPRPLPPEEPLALYARDRTRLALGARGEGRVLELSRPHDASEDPGHAQALAALVEALPRAAPRSVLAFRCGFGGAALAALALWPQARVLAQERDLLDAAFLRLNAQALGLDGGRLRVGETLFPAQAAGAERFDLVLGELSPSAGPQVAARELQEAAALLAPGGQALVLLAARRLREELKGTPPRGASFSVLLEQGAATVVRLAAPR